MGHFVGELLPTNGSYIGSAAGPLEPFNELTRRRKERSDRRRAELKLHEKRDSLGRRYTPRIKGG